MSTEVQVVTRVTINASPKAVFKYMRDLKYHYLWNPHIESLKPLQTLKKGAQYTAKSIVFGRRLETPNTVTVFIENKELEVENVTGMIRYRVNYSLLPTDTSTVVRCDIEVTAESDAFAFAKPVLRLMTRRELQSDLQALKVAVEEKLE